MEKVGQHSSYGSEEEQELTTHFEREEETEKKAYVVSLSLFLVPKSINKRKKNHVWSCLILGGIKKKNFKKIIFS